MNPTFNFNLAGAIQGSAAVGAKPTVMSASLFESIRKYIYENTGIYFQDNKKYFLESRLLRRMNYLGLKTFEEYFDLLRYGTNGQSEKKYFYEAITINETFFFRNQPQLDALAQTILPEIISLKQAAGKNKIRIWSAASSSGEEAYSIAMTFQDLIKPRYPSFELEVVGTDINNAVVETATQGIYRDYSIRNTPPYFLKKYFKVGNGGTYEVNPEIKKMASFKVMNLYDDAAMKMMYNFDVIFCANVLIYFDVASKIKVVSHLYNSLNKGGYLFIGYSETLHGISKAFKLVSFPNTVGYKKE
ncbi:MAG: protein-glutamate O-methyltransferase CheR [Melioribacteraceae bacterium]|nr:protein-glutamate O-methyltransferase CheR [Melioribacteraceae bacterium]